MSGHSYWFKGLASLLASLFGASVRRRRRRTTLLAACAAAPAAILGQAGALRAPSQPHHVPAQLLEGGAVADSQHLGAAAAQGSRSASAAAAEGVEQACHLQSRTGSHSGCSQVLFRSDVLRWACASGWALNQGTLQILARHAGREVVRPPGSALSVELPACSTSRRCKAPRQRTPMSDGRQALRCRQAKLQHPPAAGSPRQGRHLPRP